MHYDLTDLRLFLHVGELLSLTRAAEKSFLSVPSASLRIKQLEDSLQTPLLIRQAKGMQLTQAGETLLKHARIVLQQLEVLHADLRPYAKGIKGRGEEWLQKIRKAQPRMFDHWRTHGA